MEQVGKVGVRDRHIDKRVSQGLKTQEGWRGKRLAWWQRLTLPHSQPSVHKKPYPWYYYETVELTASDQSPLWPHRETFHAFEEHAGNKRCVDVPLWEAALVPLAVRPQSGQTSRTLPQSLRRVARLQADMTLPYGYRGSMSALSTMNHVLLPLSCSFSFEAPSFQ